MAEELKIILVKSLVSAAPRQKATVKALRLTKIHKTIEMSDNDAVRGMVAAVRHLVKVREV